MRKIVLLGKMAIIAGVLLGLLGTISFHGGAREAGRRNDSLKSGMNGTMVDMTAIQEMTAGMMPKNGGANDGSRAVQMLFYGIASSFLGILLLKISEE